MDKIIDKMLEHPFASAFIIGSIGLNIARIISALKGNPISTEPFVKILKET